MDRRNIPPFLAGKFSPSPGQQDRLFVPNNLIFSHLSFSKGENSVLCPNQINKALLPLKKGGRGGFLHKPFSTGSTATEFLMNPGKIYDRVHAVSRKPFTSKLLAA
jgi:hypothetical protein